MAISGGYLLIDEPIIRHGINKHTACDLTNMGDYALKAVNAIQDTPWKLNRLALDVAREFNNLGSNLSLTKNGKTEFVLRVAPPLDPDHKLMPHPACKRREDWETLSQEQRKAVTTEQATVRKLYEQEVGEFTNFARTLMAAEIMGEAEEFYFPHNMDFRTRIYPIPAYLQPQGNDFAKGLLRFARGNTLGRQGLYWMKSILAAHWGEDKLSHDARNAYVEDELSFGMLQRWVDDPVTNRGWIEADKPWQFLSLAFEYVTAIRTGDPESFNSFLPGNLDGSCNGAQHLSILGRDQIGATATNCTSDPVRHDLYQTVAQSVFETIMKDRNTPSDIQSLAAEWLPRLENPKDRRNVVKRAVMTTPYGVTPRGIGDFMKNDGHTKGMSDEWGSAKYMRDLIVQAIEGTITCGKEIQVYFAAVAEKCAEEGKALQWDTPAGFKVTQGYHNLVESSVRAYGTQYRVMAQPEEGQDMEEFHRLIGMNKKKMGQAASPNVVHSCDASHLQITTVRCHQAGIRNFSMIHDSFGCPFAEMGTMRDILRQSIVDMYQEDYLTKWTDSVEGYSGLSMSDIKKPTQGTFDINEILESEYFFS